jgi:drug/metabolite transporter (DMT)-like permease
MLELSLQPTALALTSGTTTYTWDYKRLMFGRPIALDVLGVAPLDRLGELRWLGPMSVIALGLIVGLVANAWRVERFDRWLLLLVLGTFAGSYPLMYFAQEFIPLKSAMLISGGTVLAIIAVRTMTVMGVRLALFGVVIPAAGVMALALTAAVRPQLQGVLLTGLALLVFTVAMVLAPRLHVPRRPVAEAPPDAPPPPPVEPALG